MPNSWLTLPAPVTVKRLQDACSTAGFHYFTGPEGRIVMLWQANLIEVHLRKGLPLLMVGHWHRAGDISKHQDIMEFVEMWNRDRIGPKCYLTVSDSGRVHLNCEYILPIHLGLTDPQLAQFLNTGVNLMLAVFEAAEERFPDTLAQGE